MSRLFVRLSPRGVHNPASGSARGRRRRAGRGSVCGRRRGRAGAGEVGGARAWAEARACGRGRGGAGAGSRACGRGRAETCDFSRYGRDSGRTTRESVCLGAGPPTGRARRAQRGNAQRSGLRTREAAGRETPAPSATTRAVGATSRARREGRRDGSPPGRSSRRRAPARGPCPPRDPA